MGRRVRGIARWILGFVLQGCVALTAWAAPPVEAFIGEPAMQQLRLSPDGRELGLIVRGKDDRQRLVLMDMQTRAARVLVGYSDGDVTWFDWVSTKRVVYRVKGAARWIDSVHAIDTDGRNLRLSFVRGAYVAANRHRRGDDIFTVTPKYDHQGNYQRTDMWRIDTNTGASRLLQAPGETIRWVLDANDHPAVVLTREPGQEPREKLRYRDPETREWRVLREFDPWSAERIFPVELDVADPSKLYVLWRKDGNLASLHVLNLTTNQLDPNPLVSVSGRDVEGSLVHHNGKVVGVQHEGSDKSIHWLDPEFQLHQRRIDARLSGTRNSMSSGMRDETGWRVVTAYSDVLAGRYYLYHAPTDKLVDMGDARRPIDADASGRMTMVRYAARDGLEIPARLTVPAGPGRQHPLVVLVHDRPWARHDNEEDLARMTQFLSSRGYAVLQPEHRGVRSLGLRHFEAGFRQWGLAMQDDLADGVAWAVREGHADPGRVCVMGTGYGGYAALMGLARTPETFRCGIARQAMVDLVEYASNWAYFSEEFRAHALTRMLGDPEKDAVRLRATSPIHRADEIKAPVLLVYNDRWRSIPFSHGTRMRDALRRVGRQVDLLDQSGGWTPERDLADEKAFYLRVEKFLSDALSPR